MDPILQALNDWRQSTEFPPLLPYLRALLIPVLFGGPTVLVHLLTRDDLLADIRAALRDAGLSDKQAAADMAISKGLCSRKLHGDKPLSVDALAHLSPEFFQWLAVRLAARVGVPVAVDAGTKLARQARMGLPSHKEGVA